MTSLSQLDAALLERILPTQPAHDDQLANLAAVDRFLRQHVQPELSGRRTARARCLAHGIFVERHQSAAALARALGDIDDLERARRPLVRQSYTPGLVAGGLPATLRALSPSGAVVTTSAGTACVLDGWPQAGRMVPLVVPAAPEEALISIGEVKVGNGWLGAEAIYSESRALAVYDAATGACLGESARMSTYSRSCWQLDALGVTAFRAQPRARRWGSWTAAAGWRHHPNQGFADYRFDAMSVGEAKMAQSSTRVAFSLRDNEVEHARSHTVYLNRRELGSRWEMLELDTSVMSASARDVILEDLALNERFVVALLSIRAGGWLGFRRGVLPRAAPCSRYVRVDLAGEQPPQWSERLERSGASPSRIDIIGARLLLSMGERVSMRRLLDDADLGTAQQASAGAVPGLQDAIWWCITPAQGVVRVAYCRGEADAAGPSA